ncbi:hypothetical protein CR513_45571, partial [Mucuna pruriens]
MYLLNSKARNFVMCALTESEYEKVHSCKSSKEMWNTLALVYEGKIYDNYGHMTKIFRSLLRRWRPQVTNLRASKDLKKFPMEELLGTLKVHEMELNEDDGQRKGKSIALKA